MISQGSSLSVPNVNLKSLLPTTKNHVSKFALEVRNVTHSGTVQDCTLMFRQ